MDEDAGGWQLRVALRSDVGRVRQRNEDFAYAEAVDSPEAQARGWLGLVADGVGGRPAGDVASTLAAHTIRELYYRGQAEDPGERLRSAVESAHAAILEQARAAVEYAGMGTTVTAAVIDGSRLIIAQVGDSRAYLRRDGRLTRLTRDHSLVEELVRAGEITPEEARTHKRRNLVTRLLGADGPFDVDLVEIQPRGGDVLLLCTDGLHGPVADAEIAEQLAGNPEQAAAALVGLANERGGQDNVSVIVAELTAAGGAPGAGGTGAARAFAPRSLVLGLLVLAVLVVCAVWLGEDMLRIVSTAMTGPQATPTPLPGPLVP